MKLHQSLWIMTCLLLFSAASMVWAGDHDRARTLLEQGEILSLTEIMKQANSRFPGKVLEVELEEKHGDIVYEVEYLGQDGVIMEMIIDARSGRLISVKED